MKQKPRSYRRELIYSFLTIALVAIVFLGVFQVYQLSALIEEDQRTQSQTTEFLDDYITNYIQDYQTAIETQISDIKAERSDDNMAAIKEQLQSVKENYPDFVNLYVGDKNGESLVFYPEYTEDGREIDNQNFSDRAYYEQLLEKKDTVISSVFPGRGGTDKLLVTIASPLLDDEGDVDGYVLGALDLTALEKHIKDRHYGEKGYAIVLDQDDNAIVHPDATTNTEIANLADDPIVDHIQSGDGSSGDYVTNSDGEKTYITYETIDDIGGWTVGVGKPAAVLTDTYKRAITTIIIVILLVTVLVVGISLFFANRLEKSVRHLLQYIKDYTKGFKREKMKPQEISGPREMVELSTHFGAMIREVETNRNELIALNEELEDKVQKRTAKLKNRNQELEAVNKLITSVSSQGNLAQFMQHCLKQIEPFMNDAIHILFQGYAVTAEETGTYRTLQQYRAIYMRGDDQYVEPFYIGTNRKGFLVVDLTHDRSLSESDRAFLKTFSHSLAIMLENKLLYERYKSKHAEISAVLESMSEGVMLLSNNGKIEYINDFFVKVITSDSVKQIDTLTSVIDVHEQLTSLFHVHAEVLDAFLNGRRDDIKLEKEQKSGKIYYYLLHKFTVSSDDEQIGEGWLLRDITKEEEIDTLKNNLISLTTHEFKTPITNIKGSVETLMRSEVEWDPSFQSELLEGVHEDIERIQHLINDWMDISIIDSGTMSINRNIIRAGEVIEEAIEQVPDALREDAAFHFYDQTESSLFFYADRRRVQQVLLNLFTNALRYNDAALKQVDVTLDQNDRYITISVSDNGIGIRVDHVKEVFNRFYQVEATNTRRTGGTGLGLAICSGIMEAHNGKIEVDSRPGEGSTFTLYFPFERGK